MDDDAGISVKFSATLSYQLSPIQTILTTDFEDTRFNRNKTLLWKLNIGEILKNAP